MDFREIFDTVSAVIEIADNIGIYSIFVTASTVYRNVLSFLGNCIDTIIICVGLVLKDSVTLGGDLNALIFNNIMIRDTLVGSRGNIAAVLELAQRKQLKQISEIYSIDKLLEAVERLHKNQIAGRIVVKFDY